MCIPTLHLPFAPSTPIFPKKWLRLQKLQFFISQSSLPSLEGDNNIYKYIYYYLLLLLTICKYSKSLVPPPLKTVTSVTVTTVTVFAHFRKCRRNLLIMTNSRSQKVGTARLLALPSVVRSLIIKKKLRAKHPELSIVMIFLKSFTSGIPCMESKASTA